MRNLFIVAVLLTPSVTLGWSAPGHHVIAVLAYELMPEDARDHTLGILSHHPDFESKFQPPRGMKNAESIKRWRIGVAGCWPDIIRGEKKYDRPTWHYELGSSVVLGDVEPDDPVGPLPPIATMETRDLYLSQATILVVKTFRDESLPKSERAIALCWMLHLFADGHQPLHAGSLYAPVFKGHDRGGNQIRLAGGGNLHSAWDRLLGAQVSANDVRKRVTELGDVKSELKAEASEAGSKWLGPKVWLAESKELAQLHTYTDEVTQPVVAASRGLTKDLGELRLSGCVIPQSRRDRT